MPAVSFVFTNPRHHLDMMSRVARELGSRGVSSQLVSLAELRGFETPTSDLPMRRVIPLQLRRSPQVGGASGTPTSGGVGLRGLARRAVARVLVPLVTRAVRGSRVVVVPNDTAYPYDHLLAEMRKRAPIVLMQEGIRFAMPNGDAYGTGGATRICAWGEGSREYFTGKGVPAARIAVTGSPRHDDLDRARWLAQGQAVRERLGLRGRAITFMSNPIEHQGFGTVADKLSLFERFLHEAAPALHADDLAIIVKNHAFEDPGAFAAIAARSPAADRVFVDAASPLFAALAASAGAVVLTSTAGIEALALGVPLGALALGTHGFGFEYVDRGAAVGLTPGRIAAGLVELLAGADTRRPAAERLVERHLYDRGRAAAHVADEIATLVA